MALITAVVRLHCKDPSAPFPCLWVVDQMPKADEVFRNLNQLLPGKVAVWSTDHDSQCNSPTKVQHTTAPCTKDDLQHYPVAIVTHAFFGGKGNHKPRQMLHGGELRPRALTVIDERPEEVRVYNIELSAAQGVRELVQANDTRRP
jgi:hypothetical protein